MTSQRLPARQGPRLLLRADVSHQLGSGHVMRLAALAEAAVDAGGHARILVGGEPAASVAALRARGLDAVAVDQHDALELEGLDTTSFRAIRDHDAIVAEASAFAADAVVFDGPHFDPDWVLAVRGVAPVVASLDDRGLEPLPTPVVINPGYGAEALADRYPDARVRLLGRRFHLLRREFRDHRPGGEPPAESVRHVVITMGGSDPVGATVRVVAVMPGRNLELIVVLGPGFRDRAALITAASAAEASGHRVTVVAQPPALAPILAACDLAISAAGGTLAELAYLGRPTYALAIVADQVDLAARQRAAGLVAGGHRLASLTDAALADELAALLADAPRRRALAAASAATIDGAGAARILAVLAASAADHRADRPHVHTSA